MSFDLYILPPNRRWTRAEVAAAFAADETGKELPFGAAPSQMNQFLDELRSEFPDGDDESTIDPTWSSPPLDVRNGYIGLLMVFPAVPRVAPTIFSLASKHGLIVYDGQADTVYYPDNTMDAHPNLARATSPAGNRSSFWTRMLGLFRGTQDSRHGH